MFERQFDWEGFLLKSNGGMENHLITYGQRNERTITYDGLMEELQLDHPRKRPIEILHSLCIKDGAYE